jgi:hypothetical protein
MIVLTPSLPAIHGFMCEGSHGRPHLPLARHETLADALRRHPGEPQLWIDCDIELTSADIDELRRVQRITGSGVVSGWYPTHSDRVLVGTPTPGGFHGDWCEMAEIGFGCVLIQPWVWDALRSTTWEIDTDFGPCPAVFSDIPNDRRATMEDYAFSRRCGQAGIQIVAATRVCPKHHDQVTTILPTYRQVTPVEVAQAIAAYSPLPDGSPRAIVTEPPSISALERTAS